MVVGVGGGQELLLLLTGRRQGERDAGRGAVRGGGRRLRREGGGNGVEGRVVGVGKGVVELRGGGGMVRGKRGGGLEGEGGRAREEV